MKKYSNIPMYIAEHQERIPLVPSTQKNPFLHFNHGTRGAIADYWGPSLNPVTYRGHDLFELYCLSTDPDGEIEKEAMQKLDHHRRNGDLTLEGQEVLLTYLPDYDIFLSGWDASESGLNFDEADISSSLVMFKITDDGIIQGLQQRTDAYLIYETRREQGFYAQIEFAFPNRIDIRLD